MKTILFDTHNALNAKMVDFSGWQMPLYYKGIVEEHLAVRSSLGIFDVSHMGRISVEGPDAVAFMENVFTNFVASKPEGSAIYGVLCYDNGMSVDDVIVFKHASDHCSVISNASNREKVFRHLQDHAGQWRVAIKDVYQNEGILAIQGPKALERAKAIFPVITSMRNMTVQQVDDVYISRTGYTGEKGIEIFAPLDRIPKYWQEFIYLGAEPIGLGARDTLRLEKGYALYGHELSESIAPTESVSAWTVHLAKDYFIGKSTLTMLETSSTKRNQYGIILIDAGIARAENQIYKDGEAIGVVTSGSFSPTLKKSIAIIMISGKLSLGSEVEVAIRDRLCKATVVPLPFV